MTAFLPDASPIDVAVIGGGPAGLMAAERLQAQGLQVHLFDAMPSAGRKFLLAGKGGLNLTHAEGFDAFVGRYAERTPVLHPLLEAFGARRDARVGGRARRGHLRGQLAARLFPPT